MTNAYQQIYKKIYALVPDLDKIEPGDAVKLKSGGFMDLNVDVLWRDGEKTNIALSHYYKHPSGDMIPDPDMEVAIHHKLKMAEALSYQDSFGYRQVYSDPNKVNVNAKKELNSFLNKWLNNLKMQGHQLDGQDKGREL